MIRLSRALVAALAGLALGACPGCSDKDQISAVLITLDTTNDTALGAYLNRPGLTPNLDQVAQSSVVYERARTVAPLTLPAHATIMTGLYPHRHTVRVNGQRPLPEEARTLAERAAEAGYETAAFVSGFVVGRPNGLEQGFAIFDDPPLRKAPNGVVIGERPAAETTRRALTWLGSRDPQKPFFLWVHYYDPHGPYVPAPEFAKRALPFSPQFAPYLGEVAQMDAAIGDLLVALDQTATRDKLLLVVAADHGESLFRHGEAEHSLFTYDATIRVPMMIRFPGARGAGVRRGDVVSLVDLYPTILAALDLGPAGDIDGIDLGTLETGTVLADRAVYFESLTGWLSYGWSPLYGVADAAGAYIHGVAPELFAAADQHQQNNVLDQHPERARALREQLMSTLSRPAISTDATQSDSELAERLKQLGYAGSSSADAPIPGPADLAGLPDPKDRLFDLDTMNKAVQLIVLGQREEAAALLRGIVDKDPGNLEALESLGTIFYLDERFQDVVDLYEPRRDRIHFRKNCLGQLGDALLKLGRNQESLGTLMSIFDRWPNDRPTLERITTLLLELGHTAEAESFSKRLRDLN